MPETVLVAGGAGYIGSHMVLMLLDAGYQVVVLDNLSRGVRQAVADGAVFIEADLLDPQSLQGCFSQYSIDLVMHFAAFAYVPESVHHPHRYYSNNVTGSVNLLQAMRGAGIKRLVFSSTCAIYGTPEFYPITETHPKAPINPYGRSKWMVEQMLQDHARAYGLDSISLRYFNAAGCDPDARAGERHDPETHLIPLVLREAQRIQAGGSPEDSSLFVYGDDFDTRDGSCIRDYIHVTDLCQAHLLCAERLFARTQAAAEAFNLGNGQGTTVFEIIAAAAALTGCQIPYQLRPRRPGDCAALIGSADRAREILGWSPRHTDVAGIIGTAWKWMQSRPRGNR